MALLAHRESAWERGSEDDEGPGWDRTFREWLGVISTGFAIPPRRAAGERDTDIPTSERG